MKRKMQIDHMAEGLSSLGFMDILVTFIEKMQPLFVGGSNLPTCDELWNLLKINDHTSAEVTFSYLQRYVMHLDDCGKYIMRARYTCLYYITSSILGLGRRNFLRYCTGSSAVPPMGMERIKVSFVQADAITSSTCVGTIKIPTFEREDYDTFEAVMNAMIDTDNFSSM